MRRWEWLINRQVFPGSARCHLRPAGKRPALWLKKFDQMLGRVYLRRLLYDDPSLFASDTSPEIDHARSVCAGTPGIFAFMSAVEA
jgi:hypothetical protein